MNWIRVSERMPEAQKRVLLYFNGGSIDIGRLRWHERKVEQVVGIGVKIQYNTRWTHGHQNYNIDVTHWCELEPPKE